MAQVDDVPRVPAQAVEHLAGAPAHRVRRTEERGGVQVSLEADPAPEAPPGLRERLAPVEAQDSRPRTGHVLEEVSAAVHVEDGGRAGARDPIQDRLLVRQRELAEVAGAEEPRPRVEKLNGIRPRLDLGREVLPRRARKPLEKAVDEAGVLVEEALDA